MSEDEARRYMESRGDTQGKPQQLVRVNLSKLSPADFDLKPGPNGADWVRFNREVPETHIEPVATPAPIDKLGPALEQGLGAKKLESTVPLREQMKPAEPAAESDLPEGHTPVESSALRSVRYDQGAREFHAMPKGGTTVYVYGDVSPEEADAFSKAESKGKAWQEIRRNPLVAKIVNGKRIATKPEPPAEAEPLKPAIALPFSEKEPPPIESNDDLTPLLKESVRRARKKIQ